MVLFAFLGNTFFLTILVSMLSNTFSNISTNATAEMQFRRAVLTLEGVKADAIFAYQPPFNIVAVFVFLPLKFVVSPRWFHKIHVATVRLVNLPLLLLIAVAERRLLAPSTKMGSSRIHPMAKWWFWRKWQLSANQYLRSVFRVPPPEDVQDDIAVDDHLTHGLIERQFSTTNNPVVDVQVRKPSRRDSMFPGLASKLRTSFGDATDDYESMTARMAEMEKAMKRMEAILSRLKPAEGVAAATGTSAAGSGQGEKGESGSKGNNVPGAQPRPGRGDG